ncbi:hypothetical protein R3W88_033672 [Solanum pinnatisectum]|uniref:Isopenicillin N synthase-like Fe(2+) 2OG dioxygenase domain-containing protein n=1 Tax=Solanum pinnatisectum TaxID=50273 RepID=A0AAV9K0E4_9SOLN|nr:hypothetical protein R3W88_033672 [Solanum pinnatisectum]
MSPNPRSPEEFPRPCRRSQSRSLLSQRYGLRGGAWCVLTLYYPVCPQPKLTIGTNKHSDNDFITVFLQDHIDGLQVLHQNQWVDVPPTRGALVINIADLMQASFLFIF